MEKKGTNMTLQISAKPSNTEFHPRQNNSARIKIKKHFSFSETVKLKGKM
jgi:hypothetical protein